MSPTPKPHVNPGMATSEIRLIQIGRRALGLDEDSYRAVLAAKGNGAASSKQLTADQRRAVLDHFKACGFVVKVKPGSPAAKANGWARTPEMTKLRALWWALADVGAVTRPDSHQACDDAIDAWAVRQLSTATPKLDAVRFASAQQMGLLIESLKKWLARVKRQGAAVLRDQAKNDMSCVGAFARHRPGR